jgi:hypothetical protein
VDSSPGHVKPKIIILIFAASPLKYAALKRKSKNWLCVLFLIKYLIKSFLREGRT